MNAKGLRLSRAIARTFCAAFATTTRAAFQRPVVAAFVQTQQRASTTKTTATTNHNDFVPADPPGTHGIPVFPNIDFGHVTRDALQRRQDPDAVFVVTAANRGIGFQFVKTLSTTTPGTIVACCRNPSQATQLRDWKDSLPDPSRIDILPLDLEDQTSIEALGTQLRDRYNRVDILLNVAGLLGDGKTHAGPERTIARIERDWLEKSLAVNVIGPVMLTKELVPLLGQARKRRGRSQDPSAEEPQRPTALVANLSARVGSISDNRLGGWYSYRLSKTALNQATRTLALELGRQSVWCVALHPGTTDTDLSAPFQANVKPGSLFPVEFTVQKLLSVMDSVQAEHSGGLYDWAGQSISF